MTASVTSMDVRGRAAQSHGSSKAAIYEIVENEIATCHPGEGTVVDVGCGEGNLFEFLQGKFDCYVGADVLRYSGFPSVAEFVETDLETGRGGLPDGSADVAVRIEVIVYLENPPAFARSAASPYFCCITSFNAGSFIASPSQLHVPMRIYAAAEPFN